MKKNFEILLISQNIIEALHLKALILKSSDISINISCFLSASQASERFSNLDPDLIIADISNWNDFSMSSIPAMTPSTTKLIVITDEMQLNYTKQFAYSTEFILKPFDEQKISKLIRKIIISHLISNDQNKERQSYFVAIPSVNKTDFIDMREIMVCEANGKYTTFHLSNGSQIVSSKNLGTYEKLLNELTFYRVHHTYIVNINYLTGIYKNNGSHLKLLNDRSIPIAKRKQSDFNRFLRSN